MPEPTDAEKAEAEAKAKADAEAKAKAEAEAKAKADGEKKFSQSELDEIAGKSRESGRTKAEKDLLESLGVTDLDAAKALLQEAKDAEDAKKTETERLTEERDKATAEAERARNEAAQYLVAAELKGAMRDSGINPERIDAAMRLIDTSALAVDGTTVTGIPEAIEGVKAVSPEWFGTKRAGAADASGGGGGAGPDFRNVPRDQLRAEALKHGVKL